MDKQHQKNLATESDISLVQYIQSGSALQEDSIRELLERHTGLYVSTVNRTVSKNVPNLFNDFMREEEKAFILFQAARTFDPNKGSAFHTHFANMTRWACLTGNSQKSNAEVSCESEFLEELATQEDFNTDFEAPETGSLRAVLMSEIQKIPDERARKIMALRYFSLDEKNFPWKKVAEVVRISIPGCIGIHNRWIEKIRKNIERNTTIKYEYQ